jgi:molecular chaperone GrpE
MAEEQSEARDEPLNEQTESESGAGETQAEIDRLRDELESAKNEQLRALAELENVRKRARRDVEQAHKFAVEKLAAELLNVKDSLEMGLKAAEGDNPSIDQLREGKEMTLKQLDSAMEKAGIAELDPDGEAFNPEFHEAMTMQESADHDPDTVMTVIQKGYLLNGRLLRPARVIVAKAPEGDGSGSE